ncbi:MAG: hypothetical protein KDA25_03940 [Phycisphaerales bacterium]|nr:hypothetical protein [Phycisphaerales bacterium]
MTIRSLSLTLGVALALAAAASLRLAAAPPVTPASPPATAPAAPPPSAAPSEVKAPAPTPPAPLRVIVHETRRETSRGIVEYEDATLLVIRTPEDDVKSFTKSRVMQIVRLVRPRPGQRGTVYMRQGAPREGVILKDEFDFVIVDVNGIQQKLVREIVDHVRLEPTFEERYESFRAALQPQQYEQRLAFVRWLFAERRYALAKQELDALTIDAPHLDNVAPLRRIIDAQIALEVAEEERLAHPKPTPERPETPSSPSGDPDALLPTTLLTDADVNLMQVYEIDFNDPPRVTIEPQVVRTFVESYATSPLMPESREERNRLFRADAINVVRLMFELRAREFYPEIQVKTEPFSLARFRTWVHDAWLVPTCASPRCHGGVDAGAFFLHHKDFRHRRVRYTNLLILERTKLDPNWPLINYEDPRKSLIVQYGLPRNEAERPHPIVRGWTPVFRPTNPRMLERTIDWIESMMMPRPDYPVQFDPPILNTDPASETNDPAGDRVDR